MPYLIEKNGEVVDWGLSFDTLRYTNHNNLFISFPQNVPAGWRFDVLFDGVVTSWIYYTDIRDLSSGSLLTSETKPSLGSDGLYHSTIIDPSTVGKNLFYFASANINEGDKIDIQPLTINLLSPATSDTTFDVSIDRGKSTGPTRVYPNTWIELPVTSVTVKEGESSFTVPLLVKGNTFHNPNLRYFDLRISTLSEEFVAPSGSALRNPVFEIRDDDSAPGVLKIINDEIVDSNYSWDQIRRTHGNTSFGTDMVNGSFYGVVGIGPGAVNYVPGLAYANYAKWSPPEAPDGFEWIESAPQRVNAAGLNTSNYNFTQEYSVIYPEQGYFYQQVWDLKRSEAFYNQIAEIGYGDSPLIDGTGGNDVVIAAGTSNRISTGKADDLVFSGWGEDSVYGGEGDDFQFGQTGDDVLDGGFGNDYLAGGDGNDSIDGGAGNGLIIGGDGAGNDQYIGGAGEDTVRYSSAMAGIAVDLSLGLAKSRAEFNNSGIGVDALFEIENIIAGNYDDQLIGNSGSNVFKALGGKDVIDGAGGSDTIDYSDKDKSVVVALQGRAVTKVLVGGLIEDSVVNVENLIGGSAPDTLAGDASDNVIDGSAGNDRMAGGGGNDVYYVDNAGDVINEFLRQGIDEIRSSISFTLSPHTETLTLSGSLNINGIGNDLSNTLVGNSANNALNGLAGADTLIGGLGNDLYVIDNLGDIVTENLDEGVDTIQTAIVNCLLADNVENWVAVGTAVASATGNLLDNNLSGNGGPNTIDGALGNDTLTGAGGVDQFVVSAGQDVVTDLGNGGPDALVVQAGATVTATVTANWVANLATSNLGIANVMTAARSVNLAAVTSGAGFNVTNTGAATALIGSSLADTLVGGSGNDTIVGGNGNDTLIGNSGSDSMTGGAGADSFALIGNDIVVDFNSTQSDTLNLAGLVSGNTVAFSNVTGLLDLSGSFSTASFRAAASVSATTIVGGAGADSMVGGGEADSFAGGAGNDTLSGGNGNDTLIGGLGTDSLIGGAGRDVFVFTAGSTGQTTGFDIISAFAKGAVGAGDLIDYSATLTVGGSAKLATANEASINQTNGVVTFASGSGNTINDALNDITAIFTTAINAVGEFALFRIKNTGNFYLFISDGQAGLGPNDVVVQLAGVTSITGINQNGGDLTITI